MDSVISRKLKSKDGKVFEVEEKYLEMSKFFKDLMVDYPNDDKELEVTEVTSASLEKIIDYLKNHYGKEKPKEIPKPLASSDLKGLISQWDYDFIVPMKIEEVIELINAANFLDIGDLVNLCAVRLATEMINCDVEEARAKFGITPDMTEDEMKEYDKYPLD